MIDIDDLRAVRLVAAHLGFSAAARALGVRKSAVSRSVQRLEALLRVRLFERTTREVALTDAGRLLLDRFEDILDRFDEAAELAAGLASRPAGRIRVSAGIGFGTEVLTEVIPAFAIEAPEIAVALELTSRSADLVAEGVDVAVRMGPLADSQLVATRLGAIGQTLCAAPDYLARRGAPRAPEDLPGHSLLALMAEDNRPRRWALRHEDGREAAIEARPHLTANCPKALHRLARHGAGIAASARYVAGPDIAEGRMVPVLPGWSVPPVDVSLVMPAGRERSPAVRAFVAFARRRLAGNPRWFDA